VEDGRRVEETRAREAHAQTYKRRVRAREEEFDDAVFGRELVGGWRSQWCGRRARFSSVERTTKHERDELKEVPKN
ncbi:hypothetical protein PIB30_096517, partial [Stylosanthes scabra]|nr:hypothetical protein [Stylosanthes scabra]